MLIDFLATKYTYTAREIAKETEGKSESLFPQQD
jgi:hypothetical protein